MASDSEKTSSRSFALTNRIWLILSFLLFILIFTHYALPEPHQPPPHAQPAHLRPKNYLNATDTDPNPFPFCPSYNPADTLGLKYGAQVLSKSRMHLGSGDRIQQVLNRALAGLPVTISVLGGSGTVFVFQPNSSALISIPPQKSPLVTAQATTPSRQNATPPCSSTGGTPSSPTPPPSSPTAPCAAPTPATLASAAPTTSQTSPTSSSSSSTAKTPRT